MGVTEAIGPNHYSVYATYAISSRSPDDEQHFQRSYQELRINFTYGRDIRPDLSGNASLGYYNSANVTRRPPRRSSTAPIR